MENFWQQFLPAIAAGAIFLTMVVMIVKKNSPPKGRKRAVRVTLAFMVPAFLLDLTLIAWILISFG